MRLIYKEVLAPWLNLEHRIGFDKSRTLNRIGFDQSLLRPLPDKAQAVEVAQATAPTQLQAKVVADKLLYAAPGPIGERHTAFLWGMG